MKSHLDDILHSPTQETGADIRSNKNSKRELSISPDKCNIENIEKKE